MIPRYEVRVSAFDLASTFFDLMRHERDDIRGDIPGFPQPGFEMLPVRRGREALFVLLKSSRLNPGCGVGVPLYVCSCVAHTVREAGFRPVFIDTDISTFGLDFADLARKSQSIDGLVMVYTLGRPMDFPAVKSLLPGKTIIEDCAHAIGSFFEGQPLGSLGDASFFTFGFFKPVPVGGGGLIVSRDRDIIRKARSLISNSPRESFGQILRHSAGCIAKSIAFTNPTYSILSRLRPAMNDDGHGATSVSQVVSRSLRMRTGDKVAVERRLAASLRNQSTKAFWTEIRTRIPQGWYVPSEPAFGTWNHFMFAVQAPNSLSCTSALRSLRKNGVSAARLFPNCRREMERAGYSGGCPKSEHLASVTIVIPCHRALSHSQQEKILRVIPKSLKTL